MDTHSRTVRVSQQRFKFDINTPSELGLILKTYQVSRPGYIHVGGDNRFIFYDDRQITWFIIDCVFFNHNDPL